MTAKTKLGLTTARSTLLILLGTIGAWIVGELVFNKSYMMTQDALSDPGTSLQLRMQFILCLAIAAIGVLGLIRTVTWMRK